nr:ABC transporter permease [Martelella sp. HB161492]
MPLVWTVRFSFPSWHEGLANYEKLLSDSYYLGVLFKTIALSAVVTLVCVIVCYPIAVYLVRKAGSWSGLIVFLLIAPLLTSIIMRTYGWRVIFARRGLLNNQLVHWGIIDHPLAILNNPTSAVIGLVHVMAPFMVLAIASSLQGVRPSLEESARILGASRFTTFFKITLPLTLDGIGTGVILVFMLANGSFVTVLLLGGGSMQTLPLLIYQQFNVTRDFAFAAAMSNVLLVIAVICLFLQLRLIRRKGVQ